jgi:Sulfotransferase domain
MKPVDFLIIGAQKCGTSWLHHQLCGHRDVFMPSDKDPVLSFNNDAEYHAFQMRFRDADLHQISGDANASYFWTRHVGTPPAGFNRDVSASIAKYLGSDLKLIVLLKDPVMRAVSGYLHHIAHQSLSADCSILDAPPELGLVALGHYGQHLQHWFEDFSAAQICVLPAPSPQNKAFILDKLSVFLGIEPEGFDSVAAEETIFPGLHRQVRDDGVWVSLNSEDSKAQAAKRQLPLMHHEQCDYVRLISTAELKHMAALLNDDAKLLSTLVYGYGWYHDDFSSWLTWQQGQ